MYIFGSISSYFTGKNITNKDNKNNTDDKDITQTTKVSTIKQINTIKEIKKINTIKDVYLVLNKNTQAPLGVFTSKDLAILNGTKSTYHNCIVFKYTLNDKCNFYANPIYED